MLTETPSFRHGGQNLADAIEALGSPAGSTGAGESAAPPPQGRRKILIIQGDWEAGMSRLALDLIDAGHEAGKVVFCAPDLIYRFKGIPTHTYREPIEGFDAWLRALVAAEGYDGFFLYNHYRPYNQIAWNLAHELDLSCHVFELGLIRPNCVMVFSRDQMPIQALPRLWAELLAGGPRPVVQETPPELCQVSTPVKMAAFCANYLVSRFTSPLFPNFVDQRTMNLWHHLKHSMIHLWRYLERSRDDEYDALFPGEWSGRYYAVPLQVHSDTQIHKCSDFKSIEEFIELVVRSFEKHAPAGMMLVFKVHPMDRGYRDYTNLIAGHNSRLGGRLLYVDRVHLPTLLEHSRGVVNINSSVGISALFHHSPVIALGRAVYDLPGLTFQGGLDDFWTQAQPPRPQLVKDFFNLLLATNQGRGTLSQRCFDVPNRCRIRWPEPFSREFFPQPQAAEEED